MTDKEIEKIKRLTELRKLTGIKQVDFAKILQLNRANLSAIENFRENRMLPNGTSYILEKELNVNPKWFESGEGEIFLPLSSRNEAKVISQFPNVEESEIDDKYLYAPDGSMGMKVYTVPAKAQAGYLSGYPDPEYYESFDYVIIPVNKKHSSDYLSFEVTGDSMVCLSSIEMAERSIFPGRIAVGRLLQRDKWYYKLHIHNYDYWVIAHKTKGILIKGITKHDVEKGIITIHSLNPDYKDEDLKLDDIEQMFSVVQIVNKTR